MHFVLAMEVSVAAALAEVCVTSTYCCAQSWAFVIFFVTVLIL
jgi:hypothetical protein